MLYHRRSESTSICRTNDVILICHVIWRHLSFLLGLTTGSPSSKYEHPRTSALLRNIRNIRICMGKSYHFCNLRKWKDFNKKKQLTLLRMCVKSLLCGRRADLSPFNGFWCKRFSLYIKVYREIPSATKLLVECPRTSKFYLLPKIHKPGNPVRPDCLRLLMSYRKISFVSRQGNSSLRSRPGELRERHHPHAEHTRLFSFQQWQGAAFGVHNGYQITVYCHSPMMKVWCRWNIS